MATLWKTNGHFELIIPASGIGAAFTLDEMQRLVGGYIQYVELDDESIMVVDEEGLLKSSLLVNGMGCRLVNYSQKIVGDVLVCSRVEAGYKT